MQVKRIPHNLKKTFLQPRVSFLGKKIYNLNIGQKIRYGYVISLSIAVVGIVGGIVIGDYYQKFAQQQRDDAYYEINLLHRLQIALLQTRTSQLQIIPLLTHKQELLHQQYADFFQDSAELKRLWSELNLHITSKNYQQQLNTEGIPFFLKTYSSVIKKYISQVEELINKNPVNLNLSNEQIEIRQEVWVKFSSSQLALKYDVIDDQLNHVISASYEDEKIANAALINAEKIRFRIVVSSILLSVMLAAVVASYTTRILTEPILAVTDVARRTTEELKFNRLAPVMTGDEVGVLATSLNSLIQRLSQYTHELELARQNLETRVDERTQELSQALDSLKEMQSQLIQAEKMSALGQLVAGVAHEVNNPVNFIYGNLSHISNYTTDLLTLVEIYQKRYGYTDPEILDLTEDIDLDYIYDDLPKVINSMKVGAQRIREIVLSLRNFSRLDEADMKLVNIHEGIDSTLLILQHRLKNKPNATRIEIIKEYGNLPKIECYAGQMNQVFMNILVNAIDALENQETKNQHGLIKIHTEIIEDCRIRISIKDNGPGIYESAQSRIFDPFFTTKPVGQGTGLGLSVSYKIVVDKHKGKLKFISTPGKGTEFKIEIPMNQK
ncbi:integral membrane sensor signal transduction histidine kinase [Calothrix brevissima NIES-22]|nr:integral membrane sensor signal transduction histidine kinase [Calothrix brevissima NIES-22]